MKKQKNFYTISIILFWIITLLAFQILTPFIKGYDTSTIYNFGKDTVRFLTLAENIINFEPIEGKPIFYLGYSLFIVFFEILNLNFNYVIFIQCIITLISALCLKEIYLKTGNKKTEIVLILFLFYIPIQMRNFFILSDSLFISFSIISFYYFIKEKNVKNIIIFLMISLFTFTIRPHGILILLLVIFYIYELIPSNKKKFKYFFIVFISLSFILLLNLYLRDTTKNYFFISGQSIFGFKDYSVTYHGLPENLIYKSPFYQSIFLIINYPIESIKLLFYKIFFYISGVRPYYSFPHNLFEFIYTFGTFLLGFVAYLFNKKNKIKNFMFIIIILSIIGAMITGPDWSGRYRMYIMPFIFIFASEFIENLLKKNKINLF